MVYLVGTIGFIGGFAAGQMLLYFMLRHKTKEELLNDRFLKWKYGILNWLIAALGASSFMSMYERYFF